MDTNPTKLPEVGALQAGTMDTSTRCFDLLCFGKCTSKNNLELDIQSTGEASNLIMKNAEGEVVFAEPKSMCTIRAPKGHNVWVNIELKTITTNAPDYMCLGIKKRSEDEYFYILHTGDSSRYVDVQEDDVMELVPLVSSTPLSTGYTAVNPGDTAKITSENTYDFGSVYRVNIAPYSKRWLTNQPCDLCKLGTTFDNYGKMGVGSVTDSDGVVRENQLLAISVGGRLARSSDGIHWVSAGKIEGSSDCVGPTYGNGIWCITDRNSSYGTRRSIDGGRTWLKTSTMSADNLSFANGVFMAIRYSSNAVYTSLDAETWTQIGTVGASIDYHVLIYGDGKWICGRKGNDMYWSEDGVGSWSKLDSDLHTLGTNFWNGGCYINGYFYVINANDARIARSKDGKAWEKVLDLGGGYYNITYYKNKLCAFKGDGTVYAVGLFNPDGTIDAEI